MQPLIQAIEGKLDTFLSIIGIGLSLFALYQSKSAKEIANKVKKQFIENSQNVDLGKIVGRLEILINEVKVFGPSSSQRSIKGVDKVSVAGSVQDFALLLNENCQLMATPEKKASQDAHTSLMSLLPQFTDSTITFQETKKQGSNILAVLSNLNSKLKHGLNKKITKL